MLIFISHCSAYLEESHRGNLSPLGGWGVSIFLILSGYLSAKFESFKEKLSFIDLMKLSFNKLKSRFKRVYALHFFTLLLALPFGYKALFVDFKLGSYCSLFTNILLVQSWFPIGYFGYNFVSWYLSVFMFLSFVGIPLCYLYYTKEYMRRKSIYICSILIVFQFVLCQIFKEASYAHWIIYIFPLTRLMDFVIGISLFYSVNNSNSPHSGNVYLLSAFLLGFGNCYFAYGNKSEFFSVALCSVPTCFLIAGIMSNVKVVDFLFGNKLMVWIGNISFELFLFHQLVVRYVHIVAKKLGFTPNCLTFIAIVFFCVVLSCSWQYFYLKIMAYKTNDKTA